MRIPIISTFYYSIVKPPFLYASLENTKQHIADMKKNKEIAMEFNIVIWLAKNAMILNTIILSNIHNLIIMHNNIQHENTINID